MSVAVHRNALRLSSLLRKDRSRVCSTFITRPHPVQKPEIINGKGIARQIEGEIRRAIEVDVSHGKRRPHLSVVLVGDDEASGIYVKNKVKATERTGITSEAFRLPTCTSEVQLLDVIGRLNASHLVDGILVQLPLPPHIDESTICNSVLPRKDVDGFHALQMGRLCLDMDSLAPCTPLAIVEILNRIDVDPYGKHVVVCGRSAIVGLPISIMLGSGRSYGNATVSVCHSRTAPSDLRALVKMADILVTATGCPGLITADMVKPGVCVIDVGITRIPDAATGRNKLVGDVDFDGVAPKASYITPVPGGVGPVTVAMLMRNTYFAYTERIKY
ncbi:bifunctional methylenetetrahydrofolate dehydrogenase/cyclohydrolase 2, mitochondrial-like [Ornithodoros turicata]|uniref:bifunctional methylenetetrahydrofolate dehydrogenase/cyclohydrolase 2, mitochondrial-like n=1 Tax=Ornithodoros turicata TaxID=34597 RepID=UPI0031389D79